MREILCVGTRGSCQLSLIHVRTLLGEGKIVSVIYGKDIKPLKDSRLATLLSGGTSHVSISANKFHEM